LSTAVDFFPAKIAGYTFIWSTYHAETWTYLQTSALQHFCHHWTSDILLRLSRNPINKNFKNTNYL